MHLGSSRLNGTWSLGIKWLLGSLVGTFLVAISSPLFVRSYTPLTIDATRGVWTLSPQADYRWRSEGYATTRIGPMGMPGRTSLGVGNATVRIALWGDSQAEGVCVADRQKLFSQIEQVGENRLAVFPFARSGEDASVWVTEMPPVEKELDVDVHVILIVDLPDLSAAASAPIPPPEESSQRSRVAIATLFPAFVIQGVRNLTEQDGHRRRMRFSLGPTDQLAAQDSSESALTESAPTGAAPINWQRPLSVIANATKRPVWIIYAPPAPSVIDGQVKSDRFAAEKNRMRAAATEAGIRVIDLSRDFEDSARDGVWPHGFHNGQIGVGHLNEIGYRLIAERLVESLERFDRSR